MTTYDAVNGKFSKRRDNRYNSRHFVFKTKYQIEDLLLFLPIYHIRDRAGRDND